MLRTRFHWNSFLAISALVSVLVAPAFPAQPDDDDDAPATAQKIPNTGQTITPTAPAGAHFEALNPHLADFPNYVAGQAVTTITSPDRKTLLVLTSGYNLLNDKSGTTIPQDSTEWIFAYNIASASYPVLRDIIKVPNTYQGMVWDPSGLTFYVSGGVDDNVHIYDAGNSGWKERKGSPLALGHTVALGLAVSPEAAGIAITSDGNTLVVTNYYNDSISILKKKDGVWSKASDLDLRPNKLDNSGSPIAGGEYPVWVVTKGASTAYVSSLRDREIDVVNLNSLAVTDRIKVKGQPGKMTINAAQTLLYVSEDQSDSIDVVDTAANTVRETIPVIAPSGLLPGTRTGFTGNNTNSVTLSPDEKTLYVTNGNFNDVAVVNLNTAGGVPATVGLIPTGWYPNSVSLSADGKFLYVVNGKSRTGPNSGNCHGLTPAESAACAATNQYNLQLIKAGLQSFPVPSSGELTALTQQVAANNNFNRTLSAADQDMIAFLQSKIKHIIYIVKENRTYDQVLGDLDRGNGDPKLAEFGASITPNFHNLAKTFVTLDNFYDRSEVSMDGWPWSVSARAPDVVEKQTSVNYAGRGVSYDSEGTNRNINVSYTTLSQRLAANPLSPNDPFLLPGKTDVAAPDGLQNQINGGYLWNNALRANLSIRNYGFFIDLARYNLTGDLAKYSIPEVTDPAASKTQVSYATNAALRPFTDPYFRGFDNSFPDYYRFQEWAREFDTTYAHGNLPRLEFVRFMHDHMGNFGTAIDKVNTVETQQADNDYAVGLLVEKIAHSQYKDNTLVFVIEDDSQDGADHVDSHRSIAFMAGPYVKQGQVTSSVYNTVDFVRTMEGILNLPQLNLNDSVANFMTDAFDKTKSTWNFTAQPSPYLAQTTLPIPAGKFAGMPSLSSTHDAAYWADATKGMDFSVEDRIDFARYNRIIWKGLMGDKPYPSQPTGEDLRQNRSELLNLLPGASGGE